MNKRKTIGALIGVAICALLIWGLDEAPKSSYYHNQGKVFGTYYNIRYEATQNLGKDIQAAFTEFDNSLSLFNPHSILSAVNDNRDTVTNTAFEMMWAEAERVYQLSGGAFDVTVAPLVNFWGFGTKDKGQWTKDKNAIDSIRSFIGFKNVSLVDHKVIKTDTRVQIDGGAVAKGQACDMIAAVLRAHGSENYLVDIGGEVVAHGMNAKGEPWHIGITKPNINNEGAQDELEKIIEVTDICMATSGNYRNFYYEGTERRSHTIDPRTGWPVQHSLLSATVVSSTCMRADALATACMVLGAEKALDLIEHAGDASCYLIVAQSDSLIAISSSNWQY
jgi:thiamine biosynthesis lipoprotein